MQYPWIILKQYLSKFSQLLSILKVLSRMEVEAVSPKILKKFWSSATKAQVVLFFFKYSFTENNILSNTTTSVQLNEALTFADTCGLLEELFKSLSFSASSALNTSLTSESWYKNKLLFYTDLSFHSILFMGGKYSK